MAIRPILRMGDPRLREVATPVSSIPSADLDDIITDMFDTMEHANGAGLAAPQIGIGLRIMVFGVDSNERYPLAEPVPVTALINPEYTVIDDTPIEFWEGCLSVPGMRGRVARASAIRYRGMDAEGLLLERDADGFHSIVFQHEYDHLDGILYPDRLVDPLDFGFHDELEAAGRLT